MFLRYDFGERRTFSSFKSFLADIPVKASYNHKRIYELKSLGYSCEKRELLFKYRHSFYYIPFYFHHLNFKFNDSKINLKERTKYNKNVRLKATKSTYKIYR